MDLQQIITFPIDTDNITRWFRNIPMDLVQSWNYKPNNHFIKQDKIE